MWWISLFQCSPCLGFAYFPPTFWFVFVLSLAFIVYPRLFSNSLFSDYSGITCVCHHTLMVPSWRKQTTGHQAFWVVTWSQREVSLPPGQHIVTCSCYEAACPCTFPRCTASLQTTRPNKFFLPPLSCFWGYPCAMITNIEPYPMMLLSQ